MTDYLISEIIFGSQHVNLNLNWYLTKVLFGLRDLALWIFQIYGPNPSYFFGFNALNLWILNLLVQEAFNLFFLDSNRLHNLVISK